MSKRIFTSESVTEGHPDKICDQISDGVLDAILAKDPQARVACECATTTGLVLVMGEITTNCYVDIAGIARDTITKIGYDNAEFGFDGRSCAVLTAIDKQSEDIALGVDASYDDANQEGAGGHSGAEIDKGRANATITLGRVLQALVDELEVRIVSAEGGLKDNAIPNAARAVIALEDGKLPRAQAICEELQETLRKEYAAADPDVTITFTPGTVAGKALSLMDTKKVCCFLNLYPNGIESMSMDIPGLVQTSCNLGIFKVGETGLAGSGSVRSSVASRKQLLIRRIRLLTESLGGTLCVTGEYPAWEYRRESHLRDVMCEVYKSQYGKDMKVEAIHAGLECGLFCGKIPGLDAVSFGPNLYDIHTTAERMSISSVQRVYAYLCEVLKALKD